MTVKEEGDLNLSKQLFSLHNSRVTGLQSALNEPIHAKKRGETDSLLEHSVRDIPSVLSPAQVMPWAKEAHLSQATQASELPVCSLLSFP